MGRASQPRDRRGRWTTTGRGASLGSQRNDFARALQHGPGGDNSGRSTVYAYLRDKDSPSGKAGSPYYIGVAGNVRRPYEKHVRTPVPKDERRIRMLRSNMTHQQAREWEKFYIDKYGRKNAGTGRRMLLNRTDGGEGVAGLKVSATTRAKLSAAHKGSQASVEHRANLSAALKGRAISTDHRAKISAAKQGKPLSAEHRAKISAGAEKRAAAAAEKYGISLAAFKNLSAQQRAKMVYRYSRGKRGKDLTDGVL